MDLKITALIIWMFIVIIIIGIPFIKADRDERLLLILVVLIATLFLIKNLYKN